MPTSNYRSQSNLVFSEKSTDFQTFNQKYLTERLEEANIDIERGIKLKKGTKRPDVKWRNVDLPPINDIVGHFGIKTGNGLVVIDVDNWDDLPESLKEFIKNNPTLVIKSPHSKGKDGHYYYATDSDINVNPSGCDIQGEGSIVADGAKVWGIRDGKDCNEDCCSRNNPGVYTIEKDRPITYIEPEEIESAVPDSDNTTSKNHSEEDNDLPPEVDTENLEIAQSSLKTIQSESAPFFSELMDRLNGGKGDMGDALVGDSGEINKSRQDFVTVEHLYGCFKYDGFEPEKAKQLAITTYNHYNNETPYTKDGQKRKWYSRDNDYRKKIVDYAVRQFDESEFRKLLNKTHKYKKFKDDYSDITYSTIDFVIYWLIEDFEIEGAKEIASIFGVEYSVADLRVVSNNQMSQDTPRCQTGGLDTNYPTPKQVREVCSQLDRNDKGTYRRAMKKMRKDGHIKLACMKHGVDYRVYPVDFDDPKNAEYIKTNGEKYE